MNVPVDRPRRCIARYPDPRNEHAHGQERKKVILTCEGNKALLVGANQGLPCCVEDVRCQPGRKGELVCYTVERA
jgi:hypothetical protein